MGKILAVANQKGGVGKTTTAVNLAAGLGDLGLSTLLIDMDPQGNGSVSSAVKLDTEHGECGIEAALMGRRELASLIRITPFGYQLLPADIQLNEAEMHLMDQEERERCLIQLLTPVIPNFEYIIIDCPPSLNLLTVNSLVAAEGVIVPVQCEYYALEGLVTISKVIQSLRMVNGQLAINGLLRTMYDARNRLTLEVSQQLEQHFGALVYRAIIPRNVRLAEAPSSGQPALFYDRYSAGAQAYLHLAKELVKRDQQAGRG